MPSTYTSLLRLEDQANGENDTTWGNIADSNFLMVEHAIAGRAAVTHDDTANYTLTTANNSADEARRMILNIGGALSAARNTVCPTSSKVYVAKNATTGGFATTLKTTAGTGISIPNGKTTLLFCDGTNVVDAIDYLSTLTVGGAFSAEGNVTLGNAAGDTVTVTGTITSNLIFTDATYDIGASGATRPRDFFLSRNATIGGTLAVNGNVTLGDAVGDAHTVNGAVTITDDSQALIIVRSGGGDKLTITPQAAGSGAFIEAGSATDYEPLGLYGEYVATNARTGVGTTAEITRVTSTGLGVFCTPTQAFDITKSSAGVTVYGLFYNSESANAASHASVTVQTNGANGGDPMVQWNVSGVTTFAAGIDNTDSDTFKISSSGTLGSSDRLTISTAGVVTIPNLAGTGTRTVVVDANGVLSAP